MRARARMEMVSRPAGTTKESLLGHVHTPNKKDGLVLRNARERYVISVFALVVLLLIYIFTKDDEEENDEEGIIIEIIRTVSKIKQDGDEVEEGEAEGEDGEEEEEEGDDEGEEEEDDDEAHAELLEVTVDCFLAAKAWAERKLGPGNANIEHILGMLRFLPGYEEAVIRARQEAVKAE